MKNSMLLFILFYTISISIKCQNEESIHFNCDSIISFESGKTKDYKVIVEDSFSLDSSFHDELKIYKIKGRKLYSNKSVPKNNYFPYYDDFYQRINVYLNKKKIVSAYYDPEIGLNGHYIEYYPNGKVKLEGVYIFYTKTGWFYKYNEEGELISREYFESRFVNCLGSEVRFPIL